MNIHHIAYAVTAIEDVIPSFECLGYYAETEIELDESREVYIQFLSHPSGYRIELVAPASETSPVSTMLKKERGVSAPYHICYETEDIKKEQERLRSKGFVPTSGKSPAPAIMGKEVLFMFSQKAGLIELLEVKEG